MSLWGTDTKASPEDIEQGDLGDCWLLSAFGAIAESSERLKHLYLNSELNEEGVYGFRVYNLGMPITLVIDEYLPFYAHDNQYTLY